VNYIPNSIEARDVASLVHMQTNLRRHQQEGPLVIARGEGCRVFDESGRDYLESVAGLWCASLGFGSERLAKVAYEQMRRLGYYHLYRHRSTEPVTRVDEAAKRHGLILRVVGDRLVFAPPLTIEPAEIGEIGERLGNALDDVAGDLARESVFK
jgi:adenosylmethionine-8-amino-7-oxononanoate aminotransferase